tara:strand:- start:9384 stop:10085 length:702 start_codon:yes stop_codon:yes gene_type:complete
MKKNKFRPGAKITIFFVFFAILFFSLGVWQIERGQAKANILNEFNDNLKKTPSNLDESSKKWDRVYVRGSWINSEQILIDNIINRGIAGYKVITPLNIEGSDKTILVDRGWIKQNKYRGVLPDISLEEKSETVSGILELPELGLVLSNDIVTSEWPKISQSKNFKILAEQFDMNLFPMILLADPINQNSLEYIKITPTNMTPTKHYGYSAQWFLMFVVLCAMYIWYGLSKNEK